MANIPPEDEDSSLSELGSDDPALSDYAPEAASLDGSDSDAEQEIEATTEGKNLAEKQLISDACSRARAELERAGYHEARVAIEGVDNIEHFLLSQDDWRASFGVGLIQFARDAQVSDSKLIRALKLFIEKAIETGALEKEVQAEMEGLFFSQERGQLIPTKFKQKPHLFVEGEDFQTFKEFRDAYSEKESTWKDLTAEKLFFTTAAKVVPKGQVFIVNRIAKHLNGKTLFKSYDGKLDQLATRLKLKQRSDFSALRTLVKEGIAAKLLPPRMLKQAVDLHYSPTEKKVVSKSAAREKRAKTVKQEFSEESEMDIDEMPSRQSTRARSSRQRSQYVASANDGSENDGSDVEDLISATSRQRLDDSRSPQEKYLGALQDLERRINNGSVLGMGHDQVRRNENLSDLASSLSATVTAFESDIAIADALPLNERRDLLTAMATAVQSLSNLPNLESETQRAFIEISERSIALASENHESADAMIDEAVFEQQTNEFCSNVSTAVNTFLARTTTNSLVPQLKQEVLDLLTLRIENQDKGPCDTLAELSKGLAAISKPIWTSEDGEKKMIAAAITKIDSALAGKRTTRDAFKDLPSFLDTKESLKKLGIKDKVWRAISTALIDMPVVEWAKRHMSPEPSQSQLRYIFEFGVFLAKEKRDFDAMTPEMFCSELASYLSKAPDNTAKHLASNLTEMRHKLLPYGLYDQLQEHFDFPSQMHLFIKEVETYLRGKGIKYGDYMSDLKNHNDDILTWWRKRNGKAPNASLHTNIGTTLTKIKRLADLNLGLPELSRYPEFSDWRSETTVTAEDLSATVRAAFTTTKQAARPKYTYSQLISSEFASESKGADERVKKQTRPLTTRSKVNAVRRQFVAESEESETEHSQSEVQPTSNDEDEGQEDQLQSDREGPRRSTRASRGANVQTVSYALSDDESEAVPSEEVSDMEDEDFEHSSSSEADDELAVDASDDENDNEQEIVKQGKKKASASALTTSRGGRSNAGRSARPSDDDVDMLDLEPISHQTILSGDDLPNTIQRLKNQIAQRSSIGDRQLSTLAQNVAAVIRSFEADLAGSSEPLAIPEKLLVGLEITFHQLSKLARDEGIRRQFVEIAQWFSERAKGLESSEASESNTVGASHHLEENIEVFLAGLCTAMDTLSSEVEALDADSASAQLFADQYAPQRASRSTRSLEIPHGVIPPNRYIWQLVTKGDGKIRRCQTIPDLIAALMASGDAEWAAALQKVPVTAEINTYIGNYLFDRGITLKDLFKDFESFIKARDDYGKGKWAWNAVGLALFNPPLIAWAKNVTSELSHAELSALFDIAGHLAIEKHNFEEMEPEAFCADLKEMISAPRFKNSTKNLNSNLMSARHKLLPYGLREELSKHYGNIAQETIEGDEGREGSKELNAVLRIETYLMAKGISFNTYRKAPDEYREDIETWWRQSFMENPNGQLTQSARIVLDKIDEFAPRFMNVKFTAPAPFSDWRSANDDIEMQMDSSGEDEEISVSEEIPTVHSNAKNYRSKDPKIPIRNHALKVLTKGLRSGDAIDVRKWIGFRAGDKNVKPIETIIAKYRAEFDDQLTLARVAEIEKEMWDLPGMPPLRQPGSKDIEKTRLVTNVIKATNQVLGFTFHIPIVQFIDKETRHLPEKQREILLETAFDVARVLAIAGVHFDSSQACHKEIIGLLEDPDTSRYAFHLRTLPMLRAILYPHPLDKDSPKALNDPKDTTAATYAALWATAWGAADPGSYSEYKKDPFSFRDRISAALPAHYRTARLFTVVNKIEAWYGDNIMSSNMYKRRATALAKKQGKRNQRSILSSSGAAFDTLDKIKVAVVEKRLKGNELNSALCQFTQDDMSNIGFSGSKTTRVEFVGRVETYLNERNKSLSDFSGNLMVLIQAMNVSKKDELAALRLLVKNGETANCVPPGTETQFGSLIFSPTVHKVVPRSFKNNPEKYRSDLEIYTTFSSVEELKEAYKNGFNGEALTGKKLRTAICALAKKQCGTNNDQKKGITNVEDLLIAHPDRELSRYSGNLLQLCEEAGINKPEYWGGLRKIIFIGVAIGLLPPEMQMEATDLHFSPTDKKVMKRPPGKKQSRGGAAKETAIVVDASETPGTNSDHDPNAMEIDQSDQGRPRPQRLSRATRHIIDAEHSEIEDSDEDIDMDDMSSHEREKIPQIKEEPMSDAERMDIDANSARRSKRKRGDGAQTISYKEISEADDDDVVMTRRKRLKPLPQSFNAGDITTIVKQEDDERLGHIGHMTEYLRGKDGVLELVSHIATTADYDKTNDVQFINRLEFKNAQGESTVIDVQCEYQGQDLVDVQNDMMHEALGKDYDDATITNIQRAKVDARIKELQQDQEEQFRQILDGKSPFAGEYDYRNVTKADITQGADPALLGNRSMKRLKQPAWVAEMKQIGADEKDVRDEKKIFSSEEAKVAYLAKLEERKFDVALKRIELVGPLQGTILSKAEVTAREEANSNKITEYLFDLDEGQALVASNLAGFAEVPWEFDPETGGAKYKDLPGYAVYRKPTVTVIHLDATKRGQLPTSTVLRWPQMLGFGVAKGVVHANCDDPYLDVLNRKVIPKLLIPYKKAFMPSWLEKYQKKTHDLWSKKADPHALRDRPFLEPMLDAQNRAHLGMDASVFYSIESLRQYMDKQPQGHELIAMVHVDGDHFAPMIVEKEKEGLNVQVLEPALQDRYLNALSKQLCKERGDLLTQFPINAQKLARGCISYGLQYLPYVVQHRAFFKKLRQIRRLGKEVPGRRDEVPEGPITKESIAHLKDAKRKKIQMITLEGQRNTSCLLQPAFFIGNGNETQLKQMVQQNEDLMGDVKWGEELRALQNEQAKAAGFNSYQDCVIKNREVRRDPASQKIETIAEANPLAEYGRLVLVGQAIDTIALMQQPREKHLLKEVAAIEDALAIESLESVEEKEAKQAALRTTRSEKQMRRVEDFLQEGNGLQAALEIRKAALPAELRGQSSQLVPGAMRYVVVKQELDQGAQTSIGKSSYRKATKGKHESWEDWLAAYQNKIRHGRLDPLFCNDLKQDHQAFVEGFVKYAKGKPLSPQKNPYELVKEMHHWIASDPKRKALNDKAPSPSVALSNFFREQYPQFLPLVHKGEVKRVIESSHQQEIDAMRQHYDNACADYNRERSLEKIPFEHYGKLAYRLLQQVIQSDTPFKEIKRKNLNLRVINGEVETLLKTDKTLTEESKEELKTVIRRVGEIMRDGGINSDRESLSHSPAPAQTTSRAKGRNAKI